MILSGQEELWSLDSMVTGQIKQLFLATEMVIQNGAFAFKNTFE